VHKESTLSQWLRVDEVLAALVLLHIRPLRSNLAASRDDEQGDDDLDSDNKKSHNYIRDRYAASPSGRDDLEFCSDMLVKVSRSFASVIHQLPSTLLVDIMVFYLVLRALDTIEDDTSLPSKIKITALENFAQKALLSKKDEPWTLVDDSGVVVAVGDGDERELLLQFDKVRRIFDRLPVPSQDVIVDITHRMAHGMASFVNRDFRQGTLNIEEYNLYCHYVAGLVGEGLSRLFAASGMETDPIFSSSSDQHLSNQMGLFLQKTNIIRDYLEDYVDGRAFWPQSIWKRHAAGTGDLGYFVLQNDPFVRKRSMRCLNELVTDALELVPDCLTYMGRLRCEEIFRFCAIPQVMAVATLEKCFGNLDVFTGVVKIRRGLSCKLILDHSSTLPQVHETFERFAKRICRKARRLLLATTTTTSEDATDPQSSLRRTLAACDAICDLTRPLASRLRLIRTLSRIQWALVLYALFTPSALDRAVFGAVAALLWIATTFLNKRLLEGTEQQEQHPRLIGARVLEQQVAREQMLPQALA
jgi:farnesyl-diphosphate farnesyltransferase